MTLPTFDAAHLLAAASWPARSFTPLLPPGVHLWEWPSDDGWPTDGAFIDDDRIDDRSVIDQAVELGVQGIIFQLGINTWRHVTQTRVERYRNAGLAVTVGLGIDGNNGYHANLDTLADALIASYIPDTCGVMVNWESEWGDDPWDKADAIKVTDKVLQRVPDAASRTTSAPWWAPLWRKVVTSPGKWRKGYTHPSAPYKEWNRLTALEQYVQAYGANVKGAPDGESEKMLLWGRDATQYPSLGVAAERILPALQTYGGRSLYDQLGMLLGYDRSCHWVRRTMAPEFRTAMLARKALAARGFVGPDAVKAFQRAEGGLVVDGIVGPLTSAALGVVIPASVVIRKPKRPAPTP
jgi:hypothetical protein